MAERSKAHAWKACVGKLTVGSNPTLSALILGIKNKTLRESCFLNLAKSYFFTGVGAAGAPLCWTGAVSLCAACVKTLMLAS
jgi:hypothetical protein